MLMCIDSQIVVIRRGFKNLAPIDNNNNNAFIKKKTLI